MLTANHWINVAHPNFAVQAGRQLSAQFLLGKTVAAPTTSHVQDFAFFDARNYVTPPQALGFPAAQPDFQWIGIQSMLQKGPAQGRSLLFVRFKAKGNRGVTGYEYFFSDPDLGLSYFNKLKAAAHPGKVIWEMRRAAIPYRKQTELQRV